MCYCEMKSEQEKAVSFFLIFLVKYLCKVITVNILSGGGSMVTQGEIIKELAEKLERQIIIDALSKIETMEELKEYIDELRAKNE